MSSESLGASHENVPLLSVRLTPHRSLNPHNFHVLLAIFTGVSFFTTLPFVILGAWPVAGFMGIDVAIFYFAFRANFYAARAYEELQLIFSNSCWPRSAPVASGRSGASILHLCGSIRKSMKSLARSGWPWCHAAKQWRSRRFSDQRPRRILPRIFRGRWPKPSGDPDFLEWASGPPAFFRFASRKGSCLAEGELAFRGPAKSRPPSGNGGRSGSWFRAG